MVQHETVLRVSSYCNLNDGIVPSSESARPRPRTCASARLNQDDHPTGNSNSKADNDDNDEPLQMMR